MPSEPVAATCSKCGRSLPLPDFMHSCDRDPVAAQSSRPPTHERPTAEPVASTANGWASGEGNEPVSGAASATAAKSWDDATPMEILEARVQSLDEGLQWLKECVMWALEQTAQRDGSPVRPEAVLDEEWSK